MIRGLTNFVKFSLCVRVISLVPFSSGLVLFHPLLPFPSSNNSAVYLDISTLEPHAGFSEIREAMMK